MRTFLVGIWRAGMLIGLGFVLFIAISYGAVCFCAVCFSFEKYWTFEGHWLLFGALFWVVATLPLFWDWIAQRPVRKSFSYMNADDAWWLKALAQRYKIIKELITMCEFNVRLYSTAPTKDKNKYVRYQHLRNAFLMEAYWLESFVVYVNLKEKKIPVTVKNYFDYYGVDS